jgi:alanine racemase
VSRAALVSNARAIKSVIGGTSLCAVVKADGYGHGATFAATAALEGGADSLGVAAIDEGVELRVDGVDAPILVLAEVEPSSISLALEHSLTLTVGSMSGATAVLERAREHGSRHRVHVKVDTGMHRMGVAPSELDTVIDALGASPEIDVEGLYTHLPVADGASEDDRDFTTAQIRSFGELVDSLRARGVAPRVVHCANSAGTLGYPESHFSMVRVGLSLYGYLPDPWCATSLSVRGLELEPAMTIRTRVVALRRLLAGDRPSYGRARALEHDATVVTVPFGYADGYPRHLFERGAQVLIGGQRRNLAGTVTMDQLLIDVGDDDVALGDEVVLLGRQGAEVITADEWAQRDGTISWEILTRIGPRVPRIVVD